jgi:hypothetical protein
VGHDHLLTVDDGQLADALTVGRDRLAGVAGRRLVAIAYPHDGADARIGRAARGAGYVAGFTTRSEAIDRECDTLLMGRVEAPHWSAAALAVRLPAVLQG